MGQSAEPQKLLFAIAGGLVFAYAASLVLLFANHHWLLDGHGRPLVTDFLAPFAAGGLAWNGHAVAAYNESLQHGAETALLGHDFDGRLGWPYPPQYFFLLAPLSRLGYAQAFLLWGLVTAGAYAAVLGMIAKSRNALLAALAAPWSLACLMVGQNGFLTAALMGLALLYLERRPLVSALAICLLAYKPQFGFLLPIALMAGGYYRVAVSTALLLLALGGVTAAVFGAESFAAFWQGLPGATHTLVEQGSVGWGKLQSVYGLVRWSGGANTMAWLVQGTLTALAATGVAMLWRHAAALPLKAAGLTAALLLATPYVFLYDLPLLALPVAFLAREQNLDRVELALVALAIAAFIAAALLVAPLAWLGPFALVLATARRYCRKVSPAESVRGAS